MTPERILRSTALQHPLRVGTLIGLLDTDNLDQLLGQVLIGRETWDDCPFTVPNHAVFHEKLLQYYVHLQRSVFGIDPSTTHNPQLLGSLALEFLNQHLGTGGLEAAEQRAIKGYAGGFIRVVDELTENIAKSHTKAYVEAVFRLIPANDWELRFRLAQELILKYAFLMPGERLLPAPVVGVQLEEFIKKFAGMIYDFRKTLRY